MKRYLIFLSLVLLVGCGRGTKQDKSQPVKYKTKAMTTDVLLRTAPVKNQGHSSLCWAYAMLATIETEHIMQGDSVNLSVDYVARMFLQEQSDNRFLTRQRSAITTRGMATTALRLIGTHGLTHYDAYHAYPPTDYNVLCRQLTQVSSIEKDFSRFSGRVVQLLDKAIGPLPNTVFMLGAQYTPLEFAHSVCRENEYQALTSFTHHPFGQRFVLESPDNHYRDAFMNVPIDSLMQTIESTLRSGHPVCWEGDISEPGFSFERGFADISLPAKGDIQELRQKQFERHATTDDHCMEIVGLSHDARGKRYFIMKNSWGTLNPYHGFMMVSFDYVRLKTIAVVLLNS